MASGDKWFLTRMRPYRTADDRIEGVVATFVDITQRLIAKGISKPAKLALAYCYRSFLTE